MTTPQNITDLRNWHAAGLPVWSGWNKGGFSLQWYNDLIRSGCRVIPPVNLLQYDYPDEPSRGSGAVGSFNYFLGPQASELEWIGQQGIPIVLRYGNIAQSFYSKRYRSKPLGGLADNGSPLTWQTVNGVQSPTSGADYLGPPVNWANEGGLIGSSPYVAEIAKRIPNPSHIVHLENHESGWGPGPNAGGFTNSTGKVTAWTDDKPPLGIAPDLTFKTAAEIARYSVRLAARVAAGEASSPWAEFASACKKIKALYDAYYNGMFSAFPSAWKSSRFLTGAYSSGRDRGWQFPKIVTDQIGPCPDAMYVNGSGSEFYIDRYLTNDFTSPDLDKYNRLQQRAWEWEEAHDPDSFRLIFTFIDGTGVIKGAKTGNHPPVTPEVWGACIAWLAWNNRGPNKRPSMICHYTDNAVKPTDPFFTPAQQAELVAMGRPEMTTLTEGDYAAASARALNPILDNPVVRKFWEEGVPVAVTYSQGSAQKVWMAASDLGGDRLMYEWSPCAGFATSRYTVIRAGLTYTLDGYTALVTKTPFQLWNESRPDMAEFPLEMRRAIWTYDNPPGQP